MRIILVALAALGAAGCGYIGEPLPPLANVPARVTDLAAMQRGSRIVVSFTVPRLTTEGMPLKAPALELRIGASPTPPTRLRGTDRGPRLCATRARGP